MRLAESAEISLITMQLKERYDAAQRASDQRKNEVMSAMIYQTLTKGRKMQTRRACSARRAVGGLRRDFISCFSVDVPFPSVLGPTSIFIYEFDARRFQRAAHSQVIGKGKRSFVVR
jgi:hypothetical protein